MCRNNRDDLRWVKNYRILDMYVRFCEGKVINKAEEARRFNVDERSIQRDIDDIRAFLDERSASLGDGRTILNMSVQRRDLLWLAQSLQ